MKKIIAALLFLGIFVLAGAAMAQPGQPAEQKELVTTTVSPTGIVWQPHFTYDQAVLTVAGPDGLRVEQEFPAGVAPSFQVGTRAGPSPDGSYDYELRFSPLLSPQAQAALQAAAESADRAQVVEQLRQAGQLPDLPVAAGHFRISGGAILTGTEPTAEEPGGKPPAPGSPVPEDQVIDDDLIVTGSFCVGLACADGEILTYDVIRLKENNTRINFWDNSVDPFPREDWQIRINSSDSGGQSAFYIDDLGADSTGDANDSPASTPFTIEAGAPTNAFYLGQSGRIGLGTSTPAVKLHLQDGNTPAIRLHQDTTGGYPEQIWDVAGNEANFFVRDTTAGSRLPFRIQPGAPTNGITLKNDGKVGFGTWLPGYSVELERTGEDAVIVADRTDGAEAMMAATADAVLFGSTSNHSLRLMVDNAPQVTIGAAGQVVVRPANPTFVLDPSGNLTIAGALTEASDAALKENFRPVDGQSILARLLQVRISTWNYRADDPAIRHMGPTAQDFYAAFGLGADNTHIAPLDVNGITLAAIQELARLDQERDARIRQLEQENRTLQQRLDDLEARLNHLLESQE